MTIGARAFLLGVCVSLGLAGVASAADPPATELSRVQADIVLMKQEMREQRQLILQLMQMHDALLKYMTSGGAAAAPPAASHLPPSPAVPTAPPGATAVVAPPEGLAASAGTSGRQAEQGGGAAAAPRGTISGRIRGAAAAESYVYVDGLRSMAPRTSSVVIKQSARQFVPSVAVVQVGTRAFFPNEDKIFHNVFSRTPGAVFDLGTVKVGERPEPVVLSKPGHVEVFCNIHSSMRADVLVVPNAHWTRVRADGSFQIPGVPVGGQRVVLWGPNIKPVSQRVDVTASGATLSFAAEEQIRKPHVNKHGGAYESYEN